MGLRFGCARAISAVSTWGLKNVFHRPAANFPGKIALYADPQLIADLSSRMTRGSILVVGTNGKTTVTNMLADAIEKSGHSVVCNRTGANLDSGVATALLHTKPVEWGVFECDELWMAKILPFTQSRYVVLLNLFRDQLDRSGEIDHIQQSIAKTLRTSPNTTLIYNADDPLCQAIADSVDNVSIPFGVQGDMGLPQDAVIDARMCQKCSTMLEYDYRQYGQLGSYHCPECGFGRSDLACAASNVSFGEACRSSKGLAYDAMLINQSGRVEVPFSGAYMVYNTLAVFIAADLVGVPFRETLRAVQEFDPKNGRLQRYDIDQTQVLLNLAKNPTGFNQNLKIVMGYEGPVAVAFFVNDKEGDGHDVSWLWDIDFQELANMPNLIAFAGGLRAADVQVVLKYAGIDSRLADGVADVLKYARVESPEAQVFAIANYTALPGVKADLDALEKDSSKLSPIASAGAAARAEDVAVGGAAVGGAAADAASADTVAAGVKTVGSASGLPVGGDAVIAPVDMEPLVIAHLFPTLLNLYGDNGNVRVLEQRLKWRGIPVRIVRVEDPADFDAQTADIVFIGGGPDREQHQASEGLSQLREKLLDYVQDDGTLLAICGGYQIIGDEWLLGSEEVPGLSLVDVTTKRAEGGSHNRLVGNIVLESSLVQMPVVGFENHAGRTFLGEGLAPFGNVIGSNGSGNNDSDHADGVLYKNLIGSYLHGPLLSKNPQVADVLIQRALERRARKAGAQSPALPLADLDDRAERNANEAMCKKLGVK